MEKRKTVLTYTKKELAMIAGYSYRRLFDINAGLSKDKKLFVPSDDGKYDLAMFVQRWVQYNIELESDGDMSLEDAKAKHEQVKITKTELEVARMRRELIEATEVRKLIVQVAEVTNQKMDQLSSRIAPKVYMLDNMDLVMGLIDKEVAETKVDIGTTLLKLNETRNDDDGGEEEEEEEGE